MLEWGVDEEIDGTEREEQERKVKESEQVKRKLSGARQLQMRAGAVIVYGFWSLDLMSRTSSQPRPLRKGQTRAGVLSKRTTERARQAAASC